MDKRTGDMLRVVLGGYLVWLGVKILIEVTKERPSNMALLCVAAGIFIVVGAGYALFSLIKMTGIKIRLKKKTPAPALTDAEEGEDESDETQTRSAVKARAKIEMQSLAGNDTETKEPVKPQAEETKDQSGAEDQSDAEEQEEAEVSEKVEAPKETEVSEEADVIEISDDEEAAPEAEEEEIETDYEEK